MPGMSEIAEVNAIRSRNRENSQKSTGPLTAAGKVVSAQNARRHGILSRASLLSNESRDEFESFRRRLWRSLRPSGELEALLADRVVSSVWRLRRVLRVEAENLEDREDFVCRTLTAPGIFVERSVNGDVFTKLSRYETSIERAFYRALHELQRRQANRSGEPVLPPIAVDVDVSSGPA